MGQTCSACGLGLVVEKDSDVLATALTLIKTVPIFSKMSDEDVTKISSKMYEKDFKPGEIIFNQGDEGDEFFVILSGEAEVLVEKEQEQPAKFLLHGRDFFGEKALINSAPRAATVTAKDELKTLAINKSSFEELELRSKLAFGQRAAVQAEKVDVFSSNLLETSHKDDDVKKIIVQAIKAEKALEGVVELTESMLTSCADVATFAPFKTGDVIIDYGDTVAEQYYILTIGSVT